jgi:hypothetical protein
MHGPTRIFWANLTPFSLQQPVGIGGPPRSAADDGAATSDEAQHQILM